MQARGLKRVQSGERVDVTPSRLMQARGLKPMIGTRKNDYPQVAPHAGAWIETGYCRRKILRSRSRLMQARGLKQ